MFRQAIVHLLIHVMNYRLMAHGSSSGGFHHHLHTPPLTRQLASHRDMISHRLATVTQTHLSVYILSSDSKRELHITVPLNDPLPFTLNPSSVFTLSLFLPIQFLPLLLSLLILFSWFPQLCPLCSLAVFSQTRLGQRIPNVYHRPSGCCQGINNHRIWWLLDEM